jgi:HEAT repeat protein
MCGPVLLAGCLQATDEPWSTKPDSSVTPPPSLPVEPPTVEVPEGLREAAIDVLMEAVASSSPLVRANGIEALQHAPQQLERVVADGLVDENRGVRFVAAMTIGKQRMESLAHLLEPMLRDESPSVRAAAIYGLRRCGHPASPAPLAAMIVSDDPEVRANAALVLGELGNATAAPMIRRAAGTGMKRVSAARVKMVDLQMAEAMVKLGDDQEIEVIRAALFAPGDQAEITALACMLCGRLKDERVVPNLIRLARRTGRFQQPAEVRMAATWALAQIDPPQATLEVPMTYVRDGQFQLRAQAALTLGQIGNPAALPTLAGMLQDADPLVQVAAAGAILQIQRA